MIQIDMFLCGGLIVRGNRRGSIAGAANIFKSEKNFSADSQAASSSGATRRHRQTVRGIIIVRVVNLDGRF